MYLSMNEKPKMSQLFSFIFHYLEENKLKIFRWKLLQCIMYNVYVCMYVYVCRGRYKFIGIFN